MVAQPDGGIADVSHTGIIGGNRNGSGSGALVDNLILICVIAVVGAVFVVSIVVVVCVLRKSGMRSSKHGHSKMDSGSGVVGSGSSMTGEFAFYSIAYRVIHLVGKNLLLT